MFNTKEKKERALGVRLMLKPFRSASGKSAMARRPYPPGQHGKNRRSALSEVGTQLKEKQKIRFSYGVSEAALKALFKKAVRNTGVTGQVVVSLLERRLDNVVFRLGFAPSRSVARQLVNHGHIMVNGKKTNIPSYDVKMKNVISIRPESKGHALFKDLAENLKRMNVPVWLKLDLEKIQGEIVGAPKDVETPFDVNLVVDYYSK